MLKQTLLFSFFALLLFSSCTKEFILVEAEPGPEEALFYIDNNRVEEAEFPASETAYHIAITKRKDIESEEYIPIFNAFSTDEFYIAWGRTHNYKVEMKLELEHHLRTYALENGYILAFEETGVVSERYLEYERKYVAEIKNKYGLSSDSRANTLLRNTCGEVDDYWIFDTQPWLPTAHNNCTQCDSGICLSFRLQSHFLPE